MASRLFYGVLLALVLAVLWLLLSGYWFKPLLVGFGVFAVIVALVATARMGLLDGESVPFARLPQYLKYWGWLGAEIFKANIAVVRTFADLGAAQCGYCTPGIAVMVAWLEAGGSEMDDVPITKLLEGNLCRCTGYQQLIEAVKALR